MTGSLDITFAKLSLPRKGVVVALSPNDLKLSGIARELDRLVSALRLHDNQLRHGSGLFPGG